jgi:thiosulfate/3-mercaptopyruvate sulfurtransferase
MTPLIDIHELARSDPERVVMDCRSDILRPGWGREAYAQGHIPGARFADLNADLSGPVLPHTGRHPLPDAQRFARFLGAQGIGADTTVVAYDQGHSAYAARLWWLLRALGHERVRVLDGGFAAWCAAQLPVETALEPARSGKAGEPRQFAARAFAGWLGTSQVQAGLADGTLLLVDARPADRFAGQNEIIDPVAGHVPGAISRPFTANLGEDGRFLPPAELRGQWQALLGGNDAGKLVAMCGSGVTGCQHLLAVQVAGLQGVARLYAGSFSEWIRDPQRPVATGAAAPA